MTRELDEKILTTLLGTWKFEQNFISTLTQLGELDDKLLEQVQNIIRTLEKILTILKLERRTEPKELKRMTVEVEKDIIALERDFKKAVNAANKKSITQKDINTLEQDFGKIVSALKAKIPKE